MPLVIAKIDSAPDSRPLRSGTGISTIGTDPGSGTVEAAAAFVGVLDLPFLPAGLGATDAAVFGGVLDVRFLPLPLAGLALGWGDADLARIRSERLGGLLILWAIVKL
jgi:hypothetical protein